MSKTVFKFTVIMLIVAITMLGMALIYAFYYRRNIREQYQNVYVESLENTKSKLDADVEDIFAYLEKTPDIENENYYGIGTLSGSTLSLEKDGNTVSTEVSETEIRRITGNRSGKFISSGRYFGANLVMYSLCEADDMYYILYEENAAFAAKIPEYSLDNVVVLDRDGIVIASSEIFNYRTIYDLFSYIQYGEVADNGFEYLDVGNEEHLVIKSGSSEFYLAGFISQNIINGRISLELRRIVIFIVLECLISFLGSALLIGIYYFNSKSYVYSHIAKGKYSLFISSTGRILRKNKKFDKAFNCNTLAGTFINNKGSIAEQLAESELVVKLTDRENKTAYLRFFATETLFGYRMLGVDATYTVAEYMDAKYLANCDQLTGKPNMKQLEMDYEKALDEFPDEQFCFALLDVTGLNKFKDMFGFNFYEELKVHFARRLESIFERMVYHTGDTRFLIFTKKSDMTLFLTTETGKYTEMICSPIKIGSQSLIMEFKAGYCKAFQAKMRPRLDDVLKQATFALHSAMEAGDKRIVGYYDALSQREMALFADKKDIIAVIESNKLMLYYQPQYSLRQDEIVGFEALSRIKDKYSISIMEFIEQAERNGSIIEIGNFVYKTAMEFAKKIQGTGISISLNLSPVQLMQEGFVETFMQMYRQYNLKPHSIALEITESFLMTNFQRMVTNLTILYNEGIDIHLDDFGVMYSSLLYLKKLPLTTIKIDREFVKDISTDGYSKMIVDIITQSARFLKLTSIAEGVETEEQVKTLRKLECDIIQGFYISKAIPEDEALSAAKEKKIKKKDA